MTKILTSFNFSFVSPCILVQFKQITNHMQQFSSLLILRLFTAQHVSGVLPPIIRSSMTAVAACGFIFVSWWQLCCCSWSGRPRTQHDCHHDTKVKPEAATAVTELLMMGGKTQETCWAVNKRQDNELEHCCMWLVMYLIWINFFFFYASHRKQTKVAPTEIQFKERRIYSCFVIHFQMSRYSVLIL